MEIFTSELYLTFCGETTMLEINDSRRKKLVSIILLLFNQALKTTTFSCNLSYPVSSLKIILAYSQQKGCRRKYFILHFVFANNFSVTITSIGKLTGVLNCFGSICFFATRSSSTKEKSKKGTEKTDIIKQRKEGRWLKKLPDKQCKMQRKLSLRQRGFFIHEVPIFMLFWQTSISKKAKQHDNRY